jgi:hypothetical protein
MEKSSVNGRFSIDMFEDTGGKKSLKNANFVPENMIKHWMGPWVPHFQTTLLMQMATQQSMRLSVLTLLGQILHFTLPAQTSVCYSSGFSFLHNFSAHKKWAR